LTGDHKKTPDRNRADRLLKVGDPAPDFTLRTHNEGELNLAWYRGRKHVVLAFYPGDFTPVCGVQIPEYQRLIARFDELGVQVFGISVDSLACHVAWARSLGGLSFPLFSDYWPHVAVARMYRVFDKDYGCAERAVFLIDRQGLIRFIDYSMFSDLPDNEKLFRQIAALSR